MKLDRYELKAEKSLMVFELVYAFTDKHPDAWVYATGSTKSRTRLYRMGLTKYLAEISENFDLYGQRKGEWEIFEKGVEYG